MVKIDFRKIIGILIEAAYLAIIFFTPIYFAVFFKNNNIFELNKIVLFKILVLLILFFTVLEIIIFKTNPAPFRWGIKPRPKDSILQPRLDLKSETGSSKRCGIKDFFASRYFIIPFLFIASLGASTLFSAGRAESFYGSYQRQQGLVSHIFYFLFFILIIWNIARRQDRGRAINRIIWAAVLASLPVSIYGLAQAGGFDFITWSEPAYLVGRIYSTLGQPNYLASYLLLVIPLPAYLFFKEKIFLINPAPSPQGVKPCGKNLFSIHPCAKSAGYSGRCWIKFLLAVIFCFNLLALFFTYSRAGWIGLFLGTVIAGGVYFFAPFKNNNNGFKLYFKKYSRVIFISFFLLILSGAILLNNDSSLAYRIKSAFDFKGGSVASRVNIWSAGWNAVKERPLLGYGPDALKDVFVKYYKKDWAITEKVNDYPDKAHNLILDTLLAGGIIGLIFYFSLLFLFFKILIYPAPFKRVLDRTERTSLYPFIPAAKPQSAPEWRGIKNIKSGENYSLLSFALFWAIISYLISLMFGFAIVATNIYFWLYLAVIIVCHCEERNEATCLLGRQERSEATKQSQGAIKMLKLETRFFCLPRLLRRPVAKLLAMTRKLYLVIFIILFGLLIFYCINREFGYLRADHYFRQLEQAIGEKNYAEAFKFYDYIKAEKIRDNYYDNNFAVILCDRLGETQEPLYQKMGKDILSQILLNIKTDNFSDIFLKAKIYGVLASGENKSSTFLQDAQLRTNDSFKNTSTPQQDTEYSGKALDKDYYNLAVENFNEAIGLSPELPVNYRELARLYAKNGNYGKAIENFNKALFYLPDLDNPRINQDRKSQIQYEKYLIYKDLADVYLKNKLYKEAEEFYAYALNNNMADIVLYKNIADTYYLRGDLDKAIWYNKKGFILSPNDYTWPLAIALLYEEKGDEILVTEYLNKALELSPGNREIIDLNY